MHSDELLAMIVMLSLTATVFGIFYIRSRENMAMIERGINPRQNRPMPRPFSSLKYGLLFLGAGVGLFLAFIVDMNVNHKAVFPSGEVYNQDYPQIYFALIAIGGGLGLVASYLIEKKWFDKTRAKDEA